MIRLTDLLTEFFGPFKKKTPPAPPAKRKAGDVWRTAAGNFGSINRANSNYTKYFDTEEKARAYATAKIKKAPVKNEPMAEPNQKRSDFIKQSLEKNKQKRKARFTAFKDKPSVSKDDDKETMDILRQLQQMQKDEPKEKDDDFKFGGGGGFSGGGSSGKF